MLNRRTALMSAMTAALLAATAAMGQMTTESPAAVPANKAGTLLPKQAPAPRVLLTAQQQRDSADATAASAVREERPIVPQLNIQFGRPTSSGYILPAANVQTLQRNGVDDNVAQCEAQADAQERVTCRDRLAHSSSDARVRRAN